MKVINCKIEITAVNSGQFPISDKPEIVFAGKSNVGKSSIINLLLGRKSLARVGATPGKTRQINFYNVDEKIFFVDLPGYGYANVSQEVTKNWGRMIENYIEKRKQIALVILIVDIRHKPSENDILMHNWINYHKFPCIIATSKSDKLNRLQIEQQLKVIRETLEVPPEIPILPFTALKKKGKEELWVHIDKALANWELDPKCI
ncbi:MAG TPA: ribosome biogenesis GTP-binding protein YihA/YsxC [Clostridia bacterium]|nr:ribosome biogenesis GTP-binding protein YihA/YsxC [Clostridia bacterium]